MQHSHAFDGPPKKIPKVDWREKFSMKEISVMQAIELVQPGDRVFIGSGCSEPQTLSRELVAQKGRVADIEILHFLTLGPNIFSAPSDPSFFRHNAMFIGEAMRAAVNSGHADYTPIKLFDIPQLVRTGKKHVDVALVQVTPPDRFGWCSFGTNVDINKSMSDAADIVLAQINPQMPWTLGDTFIHMDHIANWVYADEPLIEFNYGEPDEISKKIARNVAELIENGSTIQMGIGSVPNALVTALSDKRDLGIHSEVLGEGVIDLVEQGVVTCRQKTHLPGKIVTSFIMGTKRLYEWVNDNPFIEFRPTEYVNDPFVIAQNDKQVAVNAALSVDLTGQINSDSIGFTFYSGIGGQSDFIYGAGRSKGGKPIICLHSTTRDESSTRIVPTLIPGSGVVIPRGDVHYVVTEYGVAYLHGKSIRERTMAMISIAHPKFRRELLEKAKEMNYCYPDQILSMNEAGDVIQYPEGYNINYPMKNGQIVHFRPVKTTDERMMQNLYYSLSSDSRFLRFFMAVERFPHKSVQPIVNIDYENVMVIVGIVGDTEENKQIVAAGSFHRNRGSNTAEVAFTVREENRNQGLTRFMLSHLARIATEKRISGFEGDVLVHNQPMTHVVRTCGYNTRFIHDVDDPTALRFMFYFEEKAEDYTDRVKAYRTIASVMSPKL